MQERMYKVKVICLSLTWVSLKSNSSTNNQKGKNACTKSNSIFEFDLSLTKTHYSPKNKCRSACTMSNSVFWVWLEFSYNSVFNKKANVRGYVQRQTHVFEFDLSLTTIHYSTKNDSRNTCTKSYSIFWVWPDFY